MATTPMPSGDAIDEWVLEMRDRIGIAEPRHDYGDTPLTHMLNVARRNGTPYQPKHCACHACIHGFNHIADVIV